MRVSTNGWLYECKVDIGPHMLLPKLERLEVWGDRLVFQRETPLQISFSAIQDVQLGNWWGSSVILLTFKDFIGNVQSLRFADSNRLTPNNQGTLELHAILQRLLAEYKANAESGALVAPLPLDRSKLQAVVQEASEAQALKEVQGWGALLVIGGVVSLLGSSFLGLSPLWGAFILVVGLVAWRTKEVPWLIVIGLAIWWAALNNITLGSSQFIRSGLWQILIGGGALWRYFSLRRRLHKPISEISPVSLRWMAVLSLAGGVLAVLVFIVDVLAYALLEDPAIGDLMSEFISPLSVLGVSAGLSSLLAFKQRRVVAAIGMALGLLVILVLLYFAFA
jgi:hypothetical protein